MTSKINDHNSLIPAEAPKHNHCYFEALLLDVMVMHGRLGDCTSEEISSLVSYLQDRAAKMSDLDQIIKKLRKPIALTLNCIGETDTDGQVTDWLNHLQNMPSVGGTSTLLGHHGYVAVPNAANKKGLWPINGKSQRVYALAELDEQDRVTAARDLKYEKELNLL